MSTSKIDAMAIAADGNVGFGHMAVIFGAVRELSATNPALAASVADVGGFLAEGLAYEMDQAQDVIDEERDERILRKLSKGKKAP